MDELKALSEQYNVPIGIYIAMDRKGLFRAEQSIADRFALLDRHYRGELHANDIAGLITKFAPTPDRHYSLDDAVDPCTLGNEASVEIEFMNDGKYRVLVDGKWLPTQGGITLTSALGEPLRVEMTAISLGRMQVQKIKGRLVIEERDDVDDEGDDDQQTPKPMPRDPRHQPPARNEQQRPQ